MLGLPQICWMETSTSFWMFSHLSKQVNRTRSDVLELLSLSRLFYCNSPSGPPELPIIWKQCFSNFFFPIINPPAPHQGAFLHFLIATLFLSSSVSRGSILRNYKIMYYYITYKNIETRKFSIKRDEMPKKKKKTSKMTFRIFRFSQPYHTKAAKHGFCPWRLIDS